MLDGKRVKTYARAILVTALMPGLLVFMAFPLSSG